MYGGLNVGGKGDPDVERYLGKELLIQIFKKRKRSETCLTIMSHCSSGGGVEDKEGGKKVKKTGRLCNGRTGQGTKIS